MIGQTYKTWLEEATELNDELKYLSEDQIEDAFYRELEFGTGGLRGVLGAGTNRMNIYTVAKASQGLANYVLKNGGSSIAVSYDSRINSDLFSKVASEVFIANGIKVFIYKELMPTPCLSYAVRYNKCFAGIMITASHNPAKYNGYKVYNKDGCQITTEAAKEIQEEISKVDTFAVKRGNFDEGLKTGAIELITEDCYTAFVEEVKKQSVLFGDEINKDVAIVYSPLNGTGLKPVTRTLSECGYTNIFVVPEQENPDGNFPTCPFPNPEIKEALSLGLEYAKKRNADLLLATDPDCDRVGIAVKDGEEYKLLTGNEVGMLLLDYICSQRTKHDAMPEDPIMVKTIVTIDMAEKIAKQYGVSVINILTGFKFIGEQIGFLEEKGEDQRYIFGFEESYGYLSGSYVRDKDAVDGAFLICEMFAFYKTRGISLIQKLNELYDEYGYCKNSLYSYEFEGSAGFEKMQQIMKKARNEIKDVAGIRIISQEDYLPGLNGLPKSDVIKWILEDGSSVVVRPSGTEPKLKCYVSVTAQDLNLADQKTNEIKESLDGIISI